MFSFSRSIKVGFFRFSYAIFMMTLVAYGYSQVLFEINDFKASQESIQTNGAANIDGEVLRLVSAEKSLSGSAWYQDQQIELDKGFYTEFEFRISEKDPALGGGDGFAFVIQNQSTELVGGTGDNIGYKTLDNVVAIEFDFFNNQEESKNHVCLSFMDPAKGTYRRYATVHEIPELSDGERHFARVEYKDGNLTFYLDSYLFPILSVGIDVAQKIGSDDQKAWIGFTAATSEAYAHHDLLSWSAGSYIDSPDDIDEQRVTVRQNDEIVVRGRKLKITIWDDRKPDQDTISVKIGKEWVLTNYEVKSKQKTFTYTLKGFSSEMILYAHNTGLIPPNTAAVLIEDGYNKYRFNLKADLKTSESVRIRYEAPDTGD